MKRKKKRDIEKTYSTRAFVAKLRRLADALERGEPFTIRVAGETVRAPATAIVSIEHERDTEGEELEFQLKWPRAARADAALKKAGAMPQSMPR